MDCLGRPLKPLPSAAGHEVGCWTRGLSHSYNHATNISTYDNLLSERPQYSNKRTLRPHLLLVCPRWIRILTPQLHSATALYHASCFGRGFILLFFNLQVSAFYLVGPSRPMMMTLAFLGGFSHFPFADFWPFSDRPVETIFFLHFGHGYGVVTWLAPQRSVAAEACFCWEVVSLFGTDRGHARCIYLDRTISQPNYTCMC